MKYSLGNKISNAVFFLVLSLAVVTVFSLLSVKDAFAATLSISPASLTVVNGQTFTVDIVLNTESVPIDGVDILSLHYNPTILQIQDSVSSVSGVQITPGTLLALNLVNSINAVSGTVQFSQVAQGGNAFNGSGKLASITFKAVTAGTSQVTIDFTPGSVTDSNVGGGGLEKLTSVTNASFSVLAPPPPSTKFLIGDTVQTTSNLNVRATASTSGTLVGTQPTGIQGTVIAGPTYADLFHWWQINYNSGPDGWSAEDFLIKVTTPTPTPTADEAAPVISNVKVINITSGAATVTWATNEPATSQVEYGTTTSYSSTTQLDSTLKTSHSQTIKRLKYSTLEHFRVISKDTMANESSSTDMTFTTTNKGSKPPKPQGITVTTGSVNLAWTEPTEYYAGIVILRSTTDFIKAYDANYRIANLATGVTTYHDEAVTASTKYYYSLLSYDDEGVYSDPSTISFTTPASTSGSGGGGGGGSSSTSPTPTPTPTTSPTPPSSSGGGSSSPSPSPTPSPSPSPSGELKPVIVRPLSVGTTGDDVKTLQNLLVEKGYLTSTNTTGYFGMITQAAVRKYQCDQGIVCSGSETTTGYGTVGNKTKASLNISISASAPITPTPSPSPVTPPSSTTVINRNLYLGLRGDDVKVLQEYLIARGYLAAGNNTGYFGNLTIEAVRKFQIANNISATGYFGTLSRAAFK